MGKKKSYFLNKPWKLIFLRGQSHVKISNLGHIEIVTSLFDEKIQMWMTVWISFIPFIPLFPHPLFTIYDAYMRKLLGFSAFCPLHLDKFWLLVKNSLHIQTTYISTFCNTYAKHTSSDGDSSGKSLSWRKPLLKILLYHLTQHHF